MDSSRRTPCLWRAHFAPCGQKGAVMEKVLEMRFSASIVLAVEGMLQIVNGNYPLVSNGMRVDHPNDQVAAPRPVWYGFAFFDRIEASPIRETKCNERGHWKEREVRFFHYGVLVAVVTLVGVVDGVSGWAGWATSKIRYALVLDHRMNPERWVELEQEAELYTLPLNSDQF